MTPYIIDTSTLINLLVAGQVLFWFSDGDNLVVGVKVAKMSVKMAANTEVAASIC